MINDRISVNALCFPRSDWPAMTAIWNELGTRRVSFPSALLPDMAILAEVAGTGICLDIFAAPEGPAPS